MRSIVVVRPYTRRIRHRVFSLLEAAGYDMQGATIIEAATPDAEALQEAASARADALLVPFHAHRDREGGLVNGLEFLRRFETEVPRRSHLPVYMPISAMGMSSVELMLSRGAVTGEVESALRQRILFIPEAELGTQTLAEKVASHAKARF